MFTKSNRAFAGRHAALSNPLKRLVENQYMLKSRHVAHAETMALWRKCVHDSLRNGLFPVPKRALLAISCPTGIPQFRGKQATDRLVSTEQHYHSVYPLKREGLAKTPSSSPSPPSLSIICETVGSSPTPRLGGQLSIPQ